MRSLIGCPSGSPVCVRLSTAMLKHHAGAFSSPPLLAVDLRPWHVQIRDPIVSRLMAVIAPTRMALSVYPGRHGMSASGPPSEANCRGQMTVQL